MYSWGAHAAADDTLSVSGGLEPAPYAISGANGRDSTDRWQQSLQLQAIVEQLWREASAAPAVPLAPQP